LLKSNDQKQRRTDKVMAKNKEQTKQWQKTKNRQSNDQKQRTDKAMTKNKEEQTK
jgi:hypothetical protein